MKKAGLLENTAQLGDLAPLVLAHHDLVVARRRAFQNHYRSRPRIDLSKPSRVPICFPC